MTDDLTYKRRELHSPASTHVVIVPEDGVDLSPRPTAIYCEADGILQVRDGLGTVLPYTMTQGQILPFRGVGIEATGTTGTFYAWTA